MTRILHPARIVFGICLLFFGIEYLVHGRFLPGLPPAPPWTPGGPALASIVGIVLLVAAASIAVGIRAAWGAISVAILFLLCAFVYGLHLHAILQDGNVRTGAFEALGISGAAFVLASRLFPLPARTSPGTDLVRNTDLVGRILFAVSMLVFGEQHFQYVAFVATLIPRWLPLHIFLTYFTGACFVAAGLAIGINILRPLAAGMLGAMFLSWYLLLHLPRVFNQPHNNDEWVSATVALIFAAGSFAIASYGDASHRQR